MNRKAWAIGLLALFMTVAVLTIALHWQDKDTVSFVRISMNSVGSTKPINWPTGKVNVNTADAEELSTLQGMKSNQIDALLSDRELYGIYDFPEDLIYIKGIGQKTLAKIYDQLDFSWRDNGH